LLGLNTVRGDRPGDMGLAAVPGREAEFAAALAQSLAYCRAAGFNAIHVMAGVVPPGEEAAAAELFVRHVAGAAEQAAALDLTILLEPLNPRDGPGYFYASIERADEIITAVGLRNVKLMFDCYHVAIMEGDVIKRLERFMPRIGHVQIAAVPSRAEPDEGEIAYPAIFAALDALGYAGWIGCEYKPRADTDAGLDWVEKLGVRL
jgi:hydroxypyruvate isomerase